jgi:hypothetical protein
LDVSKVKHFSVAQAATRILCTGALVEHVVCACDFGEPPPAGDVIGVQVRIDYVPNLQAILFGQTHVEFGIVNGVAHGALSPAPSAKHVRSSDHRLLMKQLT